MQNNFEEYGRIEERHNEALRDMALQMSRSAEEMSLRVLLGGGLLLTQEQLIREAAERRNLDALTSAFSALSGYKAQENAAISLLAKATLKTVRWLLGNFFTVDKSPFRFSPQSLLSAALQTEERERIQIILSFMPDSFRLEELGGHGAEDTLTKILKNPVVTDIFFPRFMGVNERLGGGNMTPLLMLFVKESDTQRSALSTGAGKGLNPSFSKESFFRVASLLIEKGADVNAKRTGDGGTVLMQCLKFPEGMRFLLKSGADPDATDALGMTALIRLSASGGAPTNDELLENMEILLSAGADPFIRDDFGKGFLNYLVMRSRGVLPRDAYKKGDNSRWFRIASEVFLSGVLKGKESPGELLPESPENELPTAERGALMLSALAALSRTPPFIAQNSKEQAEKIISELRDGAGKALRPAMNRILDFNTLPHFVSEAGLLKTLSELSLSDKELVFTPPRSRRLVEIMFTALESDESAVYSFLSSAGGAGGKNFKNWLREAKKAGCECGDTLVSRLAGGLREEYLKSGEVPWSPVVF